MDTNVRIVTKQIVAVGPTGTFKTVNVATTESRTGTYQTCTQFTGPAAEGLPIVIAGASGAETSLPKNGLQTILVPGYVGPG